MRVIRLNGYAPPVISQLLTICKRLKRKETNIGCPVPADERFMPASDLRAGRREIRKYIRRGEIVCQ